MTDAQLIIILRSYRDRLQREIDALADALPDDMERHLEPYKNGQRLRPLEALAYGAGYGGGVEERPTGDFVALDGLQSMLASIDLDIATLDRGLARKE